MNRYIKGIAINFNDSRSIYERTVFNNSSNTTTVKSGNISIVLKDYWTFQRINKQISKILHKIRIEVGRIKVVQ